MNFTLIFVDKFTLLKVKCHFSCAAHLNSDEKYEEKKHTLCYNNKIKHARTRTRVSRAARVTNRRTSPDGAFTKIEAQAIE